MNGNSTLHRMKFGLLLVVTATSIHLSAIPGHGQNDFSLENLKPAHPRINWPIDDSMVVSIPGSRPHVLDSATDLGRMEGATKLGPLFLVLKSSPEQEHALHTLLDQQQDKGTPNYHKWLTPDEFGAAFGVDESDLRQINDWLTNQGFTVTDVAPGRRSVTFSATVAQVEATFHAELHNFMVRGERHFSNSEDISIPTALSSVVAGVAPLDDFKPRHVRTPLPGAQIPSNGKLLEPDFTSGGTHYLTPGDFAIIYNTQALLQGETGGQGAIDGNNQTIAIFGESGAIQPNDPNIQKFRQLFLPSYNANNTNVINPSGCSAPSGSGADEEAYLDVEWAGAVAPRATIAYVPRGHARCSPSLHFLPYLGWPRVLQLSSVSHSAVFPLCPRRQQRTSHVAAKWIAGIDFGPVGIGIARPIRRSKSRPPTKTTPVAGRLPTPNTFAVSRAISRSSGSWSGCRSISTAGKVKNCRRRGSRTGWPRPPRCRSSISMSGLRRPRPSSTCSTRA